MGPLSIVKAGTAITTSGTSASAALPVNAAGNPPVFVRVAATAAAYVRLGVSSATAVAGDILVQPGDAVILQTSGSTHIAAIQVTSAGVVQVSPMEGAFR